MSGEGAGPERMSESEWIRLHLARAPRMTLGAWRKTVKILEAERARREGAGEGDR
jgi:hypothetical protein